MREVAKAFRTIYEALPSWSQWTIPVVLLVIVAGLVGSSSNETAKKIGATSQRSDAISPGTSPSTPGEHARFVRYANAECARLSRLYSAGESVQAARFGELLRRGESELTRDGETEAVEVLTVSASARASVLAKLKPPRGRDSVNLSKLVARSNERVSDLRQLAQVISQGQSRGDVEQASDLVREDSEAIGQVAAVADLRKCAGR